MSTATDLDISGRKRVEEALRSSGFRVDARLERRPDPAVEHPSERAYVFATAV